MWLLLAERPGWQHWPAPVKCCPTVWGCQCRCIIPYTHQPLPTPSGASLCSYGFVRYGSVAEAQAAIGSLDGTSVLGHTLQVKFADADAGERRRSIPRCRAPAGRPVGTVCWAQLVPSDLHSTR